MILTYLISSNDKVNDKNDKYSLFGGAKIQKMALCVKEKGITIYGRFGLAGSARACEGCQGRGGCGLQDLGVSPRGRNSKILAIINDRRPDGFIADLKSISKLHLFS